MKRLIKKNKADKNGAEANKKIPILNELMPINLYLSILNIIIILQNNSFNAKLRFNKNSFLINIVKSHKYSYV